MVDCDAYTVYRLTKYDPDFRDDQGRYLRDEPTDIHDYINRFGGNNNERLDGYIAEEDSYVECISFILNLLSGSEKYCLYGFEDYRPMSYEYQFYGLTDEMRSVSYKNSGFSINEVKSLIRLFLRNLAFSVICDEKRHVCVHIVDENMYVYIRILKVHKDILEKYAHEYCASYGLYLEPFGCAFLDIFEAVIRSSK